MRKSRKQRVRNKKTKKQVSKSSKTKLLNTSKLKKGLKKEEWIQFKIWCIENNINVYDQVVKLIKNFLDSL